MSAVVHSIAVASESSPIIDVECHMTNGLPNMIIVGLASKAVDEAKERVRSAFHACDIELPRKRITINLAPADLPKESSCFDLPIAAAILLSVSKNEDAKLSDTVIIGELGLDGSVRAVRGIIGALTLAKSQNKKIFYIPASNFEQASLIPDITLVPVKTLRELYLDQTGAVKLKRENTGEGRLTSLPVAIYDADYKYIVGQQRAKRALEIAAAGAHNVLLHGPPGTGKSMLAKALPSILAPLELGEILEITHLHSLATKRYDQLVITRPFRTPHHSASEISIIGGGQRPRPGEISLSHRGVLFFDEFPEFSRATIEALRQPLEDKLITVARAKDSITFPADFILIATANPCPCGYFGSNKPCSCLPGQIVKYQRKLSGPVLDRIDMHVSVDEVKHRSLLSDGHEEQSKDIRTRVMKARSHQQKRFENNIRTNGSLTNQEIKRIARLTPDAREIIDTAAERLNISPRSYMRLIKVARTIADLEDSETIETAHISEALQYRHQPTIL